MISLVESFVQSKYNLYEEQYYWNGNQLKLVAADKKHVDKNKVRFLKKNYNNVVEEISKALYRQDMNISRFDLIKNLFPSTIFFHPSGEFEVYFDTQDDLFNGKLAIISFDQNGNLKRVGNQFDIRLSE